MPRVTLLSRASHPSQARAGRTPALLSNSNSFSRQTGMQVGWLKCRELHRAGGLVLGTLRRNWAASAQCCSCGTSANP